MPLFMDRHDAAGRERGARRPGPPGRSRGGGPARRPVPHLLVRSRSGEAFCVAEAPAAESLTAVHRETHGLIPNEIIASPRTTSCGSWAGSRDPADAARDNPFRTILFTDLEGSTTLLESVGQSAYMVLLTEHDLIIRRALVTARGREVKHTGDGIMAVVR